MEFVIVCLRYVGGPVLSEGGRSELGRGSGTSLGVTGAAERKEGQKVVGVEQRSTSIAGG